MYKKTTLLYSLKKRCCKDILKNGQVEFITLVLFEFLYFTEGLLGLQGNQSIDVAKYSKLVAY